MLIKEGKTNIKYLLIVVVLATIFGGITYWQYQEMQKEEFGEDISIPEKVIGDETTNWEIYRNEEYGFEIKYPLDWKMEVKETSILFIDTTNIDVMYPEGLLVFTINILETTFNSIHEWFNKEFQDIPTPEYSEMIVDKTQGLRILDGTRFYMGAGCSETIVFIKNSKLYKLNRTGPTCGYSDELFNQMLSTFRFIEEDETANWETYRNEEYGYEVKHPENWYFLKDACCPPPPYWRYFK